MAADDIRRLSDELARDPSSLAFLRLGEALRRQGQRDMARKVAHRGLQRHPHNAEAHDLLARIEADAGDHERAFDEWDMALRIEPNHAGANKGLGFLCYTQGRFADAEGYLSVAAAADPEDEAITAALEHVRGRLATGTHDAGGREPSASEPPVETAAQPPAVEPHSRVEPVHGTPPHEAPAVVQYPAASPDDARNLFADLTADGRHTALLLDASGLVMAGQYISQDGRDSAQEVGAELSGVSDEARRAMRHLELGDWTSIVLEAEAAIIAMAPAPSDGLLVVAAERSTPLGFVRRVLGQAGSRVREWMGTDG